MAAAASKITVEGSGVPEREVDGPGSGSASAERPLLTNEPKSSSGVLELAYAKPALDFPVPMPPETYQ